MPSALQLQTGSNRPLHPAGTTAGITNHQKRSWFRAAMTLRRLSLVAAVSASFASGAAAAWLWTLARGSAPAGDLSPAETSSAAPTGALAAHRAFGFLIAGDLRLHDLEWTPVQFDAFVAGLRARFRGAAWTLDEQTRAGVQALSVQIRNAQTADSRSSTTASSTAPGEFMQQMRRQLQLQEAESGLLFRILRAGSGPRPTKSDVVTISFRGATPATPEGLPQLTATDLRVKVADLMPGLAEGVQMLALEGAAQLLVPPALSFGQGEWPAGIAPGTPLMFEVQLHDIAPAGTTP